MANSVHDFEVKDIKGNNTPLSGYKGKVLLIVNTASRCGYTPQYKGLEAVYKKYNEKGFEVLAFPCNQFGNQEPGSAQEIVKFCETNYNTTFSLHQKIDVNGDKAHPLYRYLKDKAPGMLGSKAIKWNFTKFLVDKEGHVVRRYGPQQTPASISADIEKALKA